MYKFGGNIVLDKAVDQVFEFTIKQPLGIAPLTIVPTDTFLVKVLELKTSNVVISKAATIADSPGTIAVSFTVADLASLPITKGSAADSFYIIPNHYLLIECSTANAGIFTIKAGNVYVN